MPRLYVCCADPSCRTFQATLLKLQVYFSRPEPKIEDGRAYFDVAIPDGWNERRQQRFVELCKSVPKAHQQ